MREIKFRGKRTDNGRWVYGNLVRMETEVSYGNADIFSNAWIVEKSKELESRAFANGNSVWADNAFIQVEMDSVGQYTGLLDKNGVEIYEGDVVAYEQRNLERALGIKDGEHYLSFTREIKYRDQGFNVPQGFTRDLEVIGSIFDPKLVDAK